MADTKFIADWISRGISFIGVLVLVVGGFIAMFRYAREVKRQGSHAAYQDLRRNLGRAILLGLEFLVVGDIIGTVAVEPTYQNVGVLALIVLIRTFLSFSLEVEIHGRWPWQAGTSDSDH